MKLEELSIYQKSREIAQCAWDRFESFDIPTKRLIGDQWIRAIDSIGANIAEGHGRYHFADRNKFNYNARGSLHEALHWTNTLRERAMLDEECHGKIVLGLNELGAGLNSYINATKSRTLR